MIDLLSFWDSIGHPRILVIGDIILDRYTWGSVERVSPEAPVLVLKSEVDETRLGGAASVALLLRALDASVVLAGAIGADTNGGLIRHMLEENEIDSRLVIVDSGRPTTSKHRFIGCSNGKHPHQVMRVDEESDSLLAAEMQRKLTHSILERLGEFDAVLISDYAKGVCHGTAFFTSPSSGLQQIPISHSSQDARFRPQLRGSQDFKSPSPLVQSVIQAANMHAIPILVDPPRIPEYGCYRGASLLKPNRAEAEGAVGFRVSTAVEAMQAGESLCRQFELGTVIITLDREGMVLSRPGQPSQIFPTIAREICDITGAGDTAFALLGLAIGERQSKSKPGRQSDSGNSTASVADARIELNDSSLPESFKDQGTLSATVLSNAIRLANLASGLQVELIGVTPINRQEIRDRILNCNGADESKIMSLAQLQSRCAEYRRAQKTIVFTNGCFDLLHVGHLSCLKESARLGDILIVAINSDQSVRRLKGADRPIVGQNERAAMLAALECVAHVLIFDDLTPHEILRQLQPDILVKGGTTREIVGREIVEEYNGQIFTTALIDGISTTHLIEKTRVKTAEVSVVRSENPLA